MPCIVGDWESISRPVGARFAYAEHFRHGTSSVTLAATVVLPVAIFPAGNPTLRRYSCSLYCCMGCRLAD